MLLFLQKTLLYIKFFVILRNNIFLLCCKMKDQLTLI